MCSGTMYVVVSIHIPSAVSRLHWQYLLLHRNFPQGSISDMVKDASSGISYICNHIAEYGGDPNRY